MTRSPISRLKFWTVHPLVHRLQPYEATGVSFLRRCSWNTLVFWMQLTDAPSWPDPEAPKAIRYVPECEMTAVPFDASDSDVAAAIAANPEGIRFVGSEKS